MSIICILYSVLFASCNINEPTQDPVTYGETYIPYLMSTDKACYAPGQKVSFTLNNLPEGTVTVRYQHLGQTLASRPSRVNNGLGNRRLMTIRVIWRSCMLSPTEKTVCLPRSVLMYHPIRSVIRVTVSCPPTVPCLIRI